MAVGAACPVPCCVAADARDFDCLLPTAYCLLPTAYYRTASTASPPPWKGRDRERGADAVPRAAFGPIREPTR
ncbi:hypothetical protein GCM10007904_11450 [Oharaeibacter diazotrophicus]|nr:hypothetical protein GCM10007904_11450 [Oharaeibacter diazotrophicus]